MNASVKKRELLKAISQNVYRGCSEDWKANMEQCVTSERNCLKEITSVYNKFINKVQVLFENNLII
jgi:hypothetical protein